MTPASMCVALRLKSGTCRNGRVAVSFCCLYCSAVSFAFTLSTPSTLAVFEYAVSTAGLACRTWFGTLDAEAE